MLPRLLFIATRTRGCFLQRLSELLVGAVEGIENADRAKVLVEGEVMVVVLQIGRQPRDVVARVRADSAEFQETEGEDRHRPMVRDDKDANCIRQEVREDMLCNSAVRRSKCNRGCKLVMLLVEPSVQKLRVERAMDIVEAYFGAQNIEDDGRHGLQRSRKGSGPDWLQRARHRGQKDEGQRDKDLIPQGDGGQVQVLSHADPDEGLGLVLKEPPRPAGQVRDGKDEGPHPEYSRGHNKRSPDIDVVLAILLFEVVVEAVGSG